MYNLLIIFYHGKHDIGAVKLFENSKIEGCEAQDNSEDIDGTFGFI